MTGIGQLIEIRDLSGSKIARLVVGKEDKQAGVGGGSRRLRFVRKAGQDPVYRVELDTSKFTTQFGDWIEKDLLKLTPWDVRSVELDNYTLAAVESDGRLEVRQQRNEKIQLAYNDKESSWQLASLETFPNKDSSEPVSEELKDNEEIDSTKLNDLRNALGDLQIIDVARKPAGLSADLKAAESFVNDVEAVSSLQQRGFLPLPSGAILSTEGQTVIGMKDGVEYILRFGAGTTVTKAGEAGVGEDDDAAEESAETAARYLLVMAQFNEGLLEKPELTELPSLPGEDKKDADSGEQSEDQKGEDKKAEKEASSDEKESADPDVTAADLLKQADEAEAAMQKAIEARRQVERENRRKQESFDEKVVDGKKRVEELNGRFADWYYIVSDEEFKKIHLNREAVIKAKVEPASDTAPGPTGPAIQ